MSGMSQKSEIREHEVVWYDGWELLKYNRRTGGNLKTAVTTPPQTEKLVLAVQRCKLSCRSRGWTGEEVREHRRRWNC